MTTKKFLDNTVGVPTLWTQITTYFARKTEIPTAYNSNPAMDGTASPGSGTAYALGNHVHPIDTSRAPVDHKSTSTDYGVGNSASYGHLKLSNATQGTYGVSDGIAATPKAVSDALTAAKDYADSIAGTGGVSGVKGNEESTYRTGDVNLTPANIGAAEATHSHAISDVTNLQSSLDDKVDVVSGKGLSSNDFTDALQLKLNGIESNANNYTHPTTSGNKHIPSGGSSGQFLKWSADGTATWDSDNDTWIALVGATSSANGTAGYVPAPSSTGYNTNYLRADGTWTTVYAPSSVGTSGQVPVSSGSGVPSWMSPLSNNEIDTICV